MEERAKPSRQRVREAIQATEAHGLELWVHTREHRYVLRTPNGTLEAKCNTLAAVHRWLASPLRPLLTRDHRARRLRSIGYTLWVERDGGRVVLKRRGDGVVACGRTLRDLVAWVDRRRRRPL